MYWCDSKIAISSNLMRLSFEEAKGIQIWSSMFRALLTSWCSEITSLSVNYYIFVFIFFKVLLLKISFWNSSNKVFMTKRKEASDIFWIHFLSERADQMSLRASLPGQELSPWPQFSSLRHTSDSFFPGAFLSLFSYPVAFSFSNASLLMVFFSISHIIFFKSIMRQKDMSWGI